MVSEIGHVSFNNHPDSWSWKISVNDSFSVQATRSHIDKCLLPSLSPSSRWSKLIPRKLARRAMLVRNGIFSMSMFPSNCDTASLNTASDIWRLVRTWTDTIMPSFSSMASLRVLWRYRNIVTFNDHPMRRSDLFDNVHSHLDITSDHRPGSAGNTSITPDSVHAGGRVHCEL
ncbi:hypothetical protein Tco_1259263 [Tanacetum coccineum]